MTRAAAQRAIQFSIDHELDLVAGCVDPHRLRLVEQFRGEVLAYDAGIPARPEQIRAEAHALLLLDGHAYPDLTAIATCTGLPLPTVARLHRRLIAHTPLPTRPLQGAHPCRIT